MDSSGGDKDGESSDASGISSSASLHDHSDLLIPNPNFISSPRSVSSGGSSSMMITSPASAIEHSDLQNMMSPCSEGGEFVIPFQQTQQQSDSSPPNVVVDDSPLQPCMDRNKESLKVKLLMRRPMNQLVEQGILPPPTTPAAFAGQRVSLERARTRDSLKAKIQQRPARQELIRQHILEDTDSRVAPSLAEKQRMLKRARLADSLSDHLIHRPGPLELVQKNILHAPDENIDKAIKDGIVSFKATCEGHVPGPSLPNKYTCNEDDSSSDISSPAGTPDASSSGHTTEANTPLTKELSDSAITSLSPTTVGTCPPTTVVAPTLSVNLTEPCEVSLQPAKANKSEIALAQPQLILATPTTLTSPLAQQKIAPAAIFKVTSATPTPVIPPPPPLPPPQTIVLSDGAVRELLPQLQSAGFQLATAVQKSQSSLSSSSSSLGKSRSSKKSSKNKSQPKARTIKFHEYKGPSSCGQKGSAGGSSSASASSSAQSSAETSYELLLKQQQLFLQWQLDLQHKYPQILLPAAPKVAPNSTQVAKTGATTGTSTISIGSNKTTMSSFPVTTINILNQQLPTSSQQTSATSGNATPKPVSNHITLAPKIQTEVISKSTESSSMTDSSKTSETAPASPEKTSSAFRSLSLSNIAEWKVNDLKAELKKRSLPVSGSKMQLVERLKDAASKEVNKERKSSVSVKMEVTQDESSNEAMMEDEGVTGNKSTPISTAPSTPTATQAATVFIPAPNMENNNISFVDVNGRRISLQDILSLIGASRPGTSDGSAILVNNNNNPSLENNLKNITTSNNEHGQTTAATNAKIINSLPTGTTYQLTSFAKPATVKSEPSHGSNFVDDDKLLEKKKQLMEQLQKSKQDSQKVSQQKDLNNQQGIQQILQQHIQQKQRQQAIQNQLQSLIQLQNQQAEQKKQLQQQQHQAQLVLISSDGTGSTSGNHQVGVTTNMFPVAVVSSAPSTPEQTANQQWTRNHSLPDTVKTEGSLTIDDLVQTIDAKDIPKLESQSGTTVSGSHQNSVQSEMVDDVLEILIRQGELPPSAAQYPQSKSPPMSGNRPNKDNAQPPPPPPLPPPSFSVMLPTSIPFSRHHTNTSDFPTFTGAQGARTDENLSKDAQAILRISENLSNFGKTCEEEAAAAAAAANNSVKPATSNNGNSSMDCGIFTENKDFDLSISGISSTADSMDVGFADSHSTPMRNYSTNSKPGVLFQNSSPFDSGFSFGQSGQPQPISLKSNRDGQDHQQAHYMSDEPFHSGPLDMQMDTDYSDWLDTLLPENSGTITSNNLSPTTGETNLFHQSQQSTEVPGGFKANTEKCITLLNHNNNNDQNPGNNGIIFGNLLNNLLQHSAEQEQHTVASRDPLLSSTRGFCTTTRANSIPFGESLQQQQQSFLFGQQHFNHIHDHNAGGLFFGNPTSMGSTSSATTLMDTDFDELTATACNNLMNTKIKAENNICASSSSNLITEMPSTTTHPTSSHTPITTSSINDNYLWDFAM